MNELERRLIQAGQTFTVFLSSAEGEVRMPSGKVAKPDIADNKDGTVTVKYAPTEAGLHEMDIKYEGIHIPGTTAQPSGPPQVTERMGPESQRPLYSAVHRKSFTVLRGLHEQWECQCVRSRADPRDGQQAGCVHRRYQGRWRRWTPTFFLHTTLILLSKKPSKHDHMFLPSGGLSLAIEGPSKADISCVDNQDGTCTVSYLPVLPGDYSILVKYNDKHIPGSPFSAKITGNSP